MQKVKNVPAKALGLRKRFSVLLTATALAGLPSIALGDQTWVGGVGSDWSTAGNWSGSTLPANNERIYIEDANLDNMPVIDKAGATADTVYIGGQDKGGELRLIGGGTLATTNVTVRGNGAAMIVDGEDGNAVFNTSHLIVGAGGAAGDPMTDAHFSLLNGARATVSRRLLIGRDHSDGSVLVAGSGSILTVQDELSMGWENGVAQLEIIQGGKLVSEGIVTIGDSQGSIARLLIDSNASWEHSGSQVNVGADGEGTLELADGGTVNTTGMALGVVAPVDDDDPRGGTVLVRGENSRLVSAGRIRVGESGRGVLIVQNSGLVQADGACLGCEENSQGETVVSSAAGLDLTSGSAANATLIGDQGAGRMIVRPGGTVHAHAVTMGNAAGAYGLLQMDGTTEELSVMTVNALVAGQNGQADVEVGAFSRLEVGGPAVFGDGEEGRGSLFIDGEQAVVRVAGETVIGREGSAVAVVGNGGALSVQNGNDEAGDIVLSQVASSAGTLVIGAAEGSTATAAGSVTAARIVFGEGNGRLIFNHNETLHDFAVPLSGNGSVIAQSGVTRLTGVSHSFTGDVLAYGNDTQLLINGQLGSAETPMSDVTAEQFGTVGGSGTIYGSVLVKSQGRLAPGGEPGISTGVLTINGNLGFDENATLVMDLGAPDGVNDRLDVAGNLVLDGSLDVVDAGGFGKGVYRLINYGGVLDDRVLELGLLPIGWTPDEVGIQTAILGQVNLFVGEQPTTTNFWNGGHQTANGTVNGGTGEWTATATNWTNMSGTESGAYSPATFAVFMGEPGTVRVNNADGAVSTSGMQFGTDGYSVRGDDIALSGAANIRVGDGSAVGRGYKATIESNLIGSGSLTKTDLGTLLLSGDNSFSGGTTVRAGALIVNGKLVGSLDVLGGVLGGSGTVGNVALAGGTILSPGNSIGTLNVANITYDANSVYEVEVDNTGRSDLVVASGVAIINGGTVKVLAENRTDDGSTYAPNTSYTILTAADGVYGTFAETQEDFAYLTANLSYDPTSVHLTLVRDTQSAPSFCLSGFMANQCSTANAVETIGPGNAVYDAVLTLGTNAAPHAFDLLSGEVHASAKAVLMEDSRFAREAALGRLRLALDGTAADRSGMAEKRINDAFAFWGQGLGSWGNWTGDGNAASLDRSLGGLFLGGDAAIGNNVRLGLFGGYSNSSFDVADRNSSGSSQNWHLGVYGGTQLGKLGLRFGGAYAWHDIASARSAAFTGFSNDLSAEYSAQTGQVFGEAGYRFDAGKASFEPFANLAYVGLSTDGYSEAGGAAALTAGSQSMSTTFTTIGLRAKTEVGFGETTARLTGMAGWRHAFGDVDTFATHAFSGSGAFIVAGVPIAQDAFALDLGATVNLTKDATLGVAYGGQFGSGLVDQSLKANLAVRF